MIKINKPYLEKGSGDSEGYTRLCSRIELDNEPTVIWYEVEDKYAQYLCEEKADAFLVGILPLAMAFGHEIRVEGVPVSEKLYWQMSNMFLTAMAKYTNYYKQIHIDAELTSLSFEAHAVGTGFSAGVDAFYTVLRNTKQVTKTFNITHLTFFNVGACGSYGGKIAEDRYHKRISLNEAYVKSLGVEFVKVNSNISEFVSMSFNATHTYRSMSAVLALQKLFGKYYYSAGLTLKDFAFDSYDSTYYDLLNAHCFSTESTDFFSTGAVETRMEKLEYISRFPDTYSLLNVCNNNDENCRICEKCIRTMAGLYSIGALEKYAPVFDVDYFKKHLVYNMAFVMAKAKDGTVDAPFFKEILRYMRKNKVRIPFLSYIRTIPMSTKCIFYGLARKSKTLRHLYHKHIYKKEGIRFADQ